MVAVVKEVELDEIISTLDVEEVGKSSINKEYYDRWHVRFNDTLMLVREDVLRLADFSSKTQMDFYLLTYAAYHYAPPLPSDFSTKNAIRSVQSYSDLVSRKRIFDNLSRLQVPGGRPCRIAVSNRAAGILSKYPIPKTFMVNLLYAGLFSNLLDLPEVYRAECLEVYNQLLSAYYRAVEEPLNVRKEAENLLKTFGKMKIQYYVAAMRENGISEQDAYDILDELASQGFVKLEGLVIKWIG